MILFGIFLIGYAIGLFIGNLYWKLKNRADEKDLYFGNNLIRQKPDPNFWKNIPTVAGIDFTKIIEEENENDKR